MDKGYESILKVLNEEEKIIFTTDKNFKFGEKNTLVTGDKFFCISNLGVIYIADKSRRLKAIKVNKYDHKEKNLKFKVLNKENIVAINSREFTDNRNDGFIINMKMDDFVNVCKKVTKNPFKVEWKKYTAKIDEGAYESAIITLKEELISVNTLNYKVDLNYKDIIDFKVKGDSIHIISNDKEAYNTLIYGFNKSVDLISKKIFDFRNTKANENKHITYFKDDYEDLDQLGAKEVVIESYTQTKTLDKPTIDATIIDTDGSFRAELDKTISHYYKKEIETLKVEKEVSIEPKIDVNTIKAEISKNLFTKNNIELKKVDTSSYGKLFGYLNSIMYKGRNAEISIEDEFKIIDKELDKELISVSFSEFEYTKNDTVIILRQEENMMLINLEEQDLDLDLIMKNHIKTDKYIGYTSEFQPFEVEFEKEKLILKQGKNFTLREINSNEIADINILEGNLNFENIAITLTNSEIYKIFIMRTAVKDFIKELYKIKTYKKYINLEEDKLVEIFNDTIIDELKIFYFADIFKMKVLIDDFYKSDVKNRKQLIETIYNTVSKLKKSYDLTSMYYFEKFDINFDFKKIEKVIFLEKIQNEIGSSLNTIANSLSRLSCLTGDKVTTVINSKLSNDMEYVFEKIGINLVNCSYSEVILNSEIDDYKFDEIIKEVALELNYILGIKLNYYYKLVKCVVSEINLSSELTNEKLIEFIIEFFVEMQMKSRTDNKTRLKDILVSINKLNVSNKKNINKIDVLNLVTF
ncbi:hypothetical protein [uncultured Clostridium sp.]|jgi:predicted HicB family RNase H-like nuclease|uniref:hypothetical protein n=1 Tax=uncultured Clostridium sp. TaxID=59620 RepID=UPI00260F27F0|nr:hypothetical protein [uncultured Clostridium sp.]